MVDGSCVATTVAPSVADSLSIISRDGTSFARDVVRFLVGALKSMCISIVTGKYSTYIRNRINGRRRALSARCMKPASGEDDSRSHRMSAASRRPAPGAPVVEAVSNSSVRVHFVAVPGDTHVAVYIHARCRGDLVSSRCSVDGFSGKVVPFGDRARAFTCADANFVVVVGLSHESTYTATIRSRASDAVDWGSESPHSYAISLCNAFQIPGAPVAVKHGDDGILIRWAVPYGTTNVALFVWRDKDLHIIDHATGALVKFGTPGLMGWPVTSTRCLVDGLPDGEYVCMIACYNGVLWGTCSPHSTLLRIAYREACVSSCAMCHTASNVDDCRAGTMLVTDVPMHVHRRKYRIVPEVRAASGEK